MSIIQLLTAQQLRRAAVIKDKITTLERDLAKIAKDMGGIIGIPFVSRKFGRRKMGAAARKRIGAAQRVRWAKVKEKRKSRAKRKFSAAGRARLIAALKLRWAKASRKSTKPKTTGRRKLSAAAKARLAAIARARWAKVKAAGKKAL